MATLGATDEEVMASDHSLPADIATANSPLFRLPRELRDKIYTLVILSEDVFHHSLALEAGKKPQPTATLVTSATARACKKLKNEYTASVERFVRKLVAGQKLSGIGLGGSGPTRGAKRLRIPQLQIAYTQRADAGRILQVKAMKISIQVFGALAGAATLFLTFKFPGFEGSGPCHCVDILWGEFVEKRTRFEIPSPLEPSLHQIVNTARAVNWKGSLREYIFWKGYIVRHLPKAYES